MYQGEGGIDFFRTACESEIWLNILALCGISAWVGFMFGVERGKQQKEPRI